MLQAIDRWVGKTLFVPPIVRLCQRTKMTQYAVSAYAEFAGALLMVWAGPELWVQIIFGVIATADMVRAGLFPNLPLSAPAWGWRILQMTMLVVDVGLWLDGDATRKGWAGFWLLVLTASYALTIKTIPPLETKERKPSGKLAYAKRGA